jgi:hypothetical protein
MRMLSRIIPVVALAVLTLSPSLGAQEKRTGDAFSWYVGPQGGTIIFETPNQTRGAIPSVGGHFLIMARRTGLLLSFDEGIADNQKTSFADPSAPGGVRNVTFNDLRKYSAILVAYPFAAICSRSWASASILQAANSTPEHRRRLRRTA